MTFLIRTIAVILLLGLSTLAFGEPGWETKLMVTINTETVGYTDSNACLSTPYRDYWTNTMPNNGKLL